MVFSAHVHHGMDYAESPEILEDDDEGHQKGLPPRHKVNMTNFSLQKNQKDKASLKQQSEFQSYILHQVMTLSGCWVIYSAIRADRYFLKSYFLKQKMAFIFSYLGG